MPPPDHGHTSYSVGIVAAYFGSQLGLLRRCQAVSTAAGSGLNLKVDLTLNGCSKKFTAAAAREDASESGEWSTTPVSTTDYSTYNY